MKRTAILLGLLCCLAPSLFASAWLYGDGSGWALLSTNHSDSRYQTVFSLEELDLVHGDWSGIALSMWQGEGYDFTNLRIRGRWIASEDYLDSFADGDFINQDLNLLFSGTVSMDNIDPDSETIQIDFDTPMVVPMNGAWGIVLDLCLDNDSSGPGWTYLNTNGQGSIHSVMYSSHNTDPLFNLLDAAAGSATTYRPEVKLLGLSREISGVLYPGMLPDTLCADLVVPADEGLAIYRGTTLNFGYDTGLSVLGWLEAQGQPSSRIDFGGDRWNGIEFLSLASWTTSLIQQACIHDATPGARYELSGARSPITITESAASLVLEDIEIHNCFGFGAGGIHSYDPGLSMNRVFIHDCIGFSSGGVSLRYFENTCTDLRIESCSSTSAAGLYLYNGRGSFQNLNLINNRSENAHPDLYLDFSYGDHFHNCTFVQDTTGSESAFISATTPVFFENCLFMTPSTDGVYISSGSAIFSYCSTPTGAAFFSTHAPYGNAILAEGNISYSGPFDYENLCAVNSSSAIVDAGNPADFDPDLTRKDIGAFYFDQSAPSPYFFQDIPEDQGHQLSLSWFASSMDLAQANDQWFYSVWRLDSLYEEARSQEGIWLRDFSEIAHLDPGDTPIRVEAPGGNIWGFVAQVPATQSEFYELVVPTLHDQLGGSPYVTRTLVYWHADDVLASSAIMQGVSVDNIPPDAPLSLTATPSGDTIALSWDTVTSGTLNGVTLPERNGVVYHIYASEKAWFEIEDADYLGSVSEPHITLPLVNNSRRFFRVVADDGQ